MISDREIEAEQARAEEALERHQMKTVERCGNCRFWKKDHDHTDGEEGWCRRYPPQLTQFDPSWDTNGCDPLAWASPRMSPREWCGEWQPILSPEK